MCLNKQFYIVKFNLKTIQLYNKKIFNISCFLKNQKDLLNFNSRKIKILDKQMFYILERSIIIF